MSSLFDSLLRSHLHHPSASATLLVLLFQSLSNIFRDQKEKRDLPTKKSLLENELFRPFLAVFVFLEGLDFVKYVLFYNITEVFCEWDRTVRTDVYERTIGFSFQRIKCRFNL